ncbi:helix-turn-helix transcriptional regulator (plasmid) [Xenorhabdus sp. SF857]|nr:helix-turn-helix transcriptional regulator [Xenorhabdus sp. SF857]WFQ78177.1 helix-turn-helix transcriptional regulator [Xenorhabdus sp. SF857]
MSQQQLSRYETGDNQISAARLFQFALILDTPINWFFVDCYSKPKNHDGYEVVDFHSKRRK